jgi:hypothetical protein
MLARGELPRDDMSWLLIDEYLRELESLRNVSGLDTEAIIRDASRVY